MVIRTLKILGILLVLLTVSPALACFGPKLYLGVGEDATGKVLAAFVAIYVKETTGTDVVRVPLNRRDPQSEISNELIDFAFTDKMDSGSVLLLSIDGLPALITGPRIDQDLQFTTVRPTLTRLGSKLTSDDVSVLSEKVSTGDMAMDVVRQFLIDRRWI